MAKRKNQYKGEASASPSVVGDSSVEVTAPPIAEDDAVWSADWASTPVGDSLISKIEEIGTIVAIGETEIIAPLPATTEPEPDWHSEALDLKAANKTLSMFNVTLETELEKLKIELSLLRETQTRYEEQLVNVTAQRDEMEQAIGHLQSKLDESEDRLANSQFSLRESENWIASLKTCRLFTVTPQYVPGQSKETRRFILAKDISEAIRKVTASGLHASDIANTAMVTETVIV